ncbi:hypothetical protein IBX65_07650 [Candidatus Aerophobetes bacterium]|nr:hypothetical protein [Candidatus Aerophobetes bacterium]
MVYNIIGAPRVVFSLKKGTFREFVFSTSNPQKVMELVKQKVVSRGSDLDIEVFTTGEEPEKTDINLINPDGKGVTISYFTFREITLQCN